MKTPKKTKDSGKVKRKLKLVKPQPVEHPEPPFFPDFSGSDVQPPPGFRVVSTSQALMEYGAPIMELLEPDVRDANKLNEVFRIVTELWNFAIDTKKAPMQKKSRAEMLSLISGALSLDEEEAEKILMMMLERKLFLFPEDIQPLGTPFTFMRKEVSYLIAKFDDSKLSLSPKVFPPTIADAKVFENLNKLDRYIKQHADFGEFEKLLMKIQNGLEKRFRVWLSAKRVGEYEEQINFIAGVYFAFFYSYEHEPPIILRDRPGKYLVEFTLDFLVRKTSLEPWEYTLAPAAMKLFYQFLYEKEYVVDPPDIMTEFIDLIEPHLIEHLKAQFS